MVPTEISAAAVAKLIERLHTESKQVLPFSDVHFVDKSQAMVQAFAVELLKVARSAGFKVI